MASNTEFPELKNAITPSDLENFEAIEIISKPDEFGKIFRTLFYNRSYNGKKQMSVETFDRMKGERYWSHSVWNIVSFVTVADIINRILRSVKDKSPKSMKYYTIESTQESTDPYEHPFAIGKIRIVPKANTTLKGFKTATYGRKPHRDNITQLENSVRKMF